MKHFTENLHNLKKKLNYFDQNWKLWIS